VVQKRQPSPRKHPAGGPRPARAGTGAATAFDALTQMPRAQAMRANGWAANTLQSSAGSRKTLPSALTRASSTSPGYAQTRLRDEIRAGQSKPPPRCSPTRIWPGSVRQAGRKKHWPAPTPLSARSLALKVRTTALGGCCCFPCGAEANRGAAWPLGNHAFHQSIAKICRQRQPDPRVERACRCS